MLKPPISVPHGIELNWVQIRLQLNEKEKQQEKTTGKNNKTKR